MISPAICPVLPTPSSHVISQLTDLMTAVMGFNQVYGPGVNHYSEGEISPSPGLELWECQFSVQQTRFRQ